MEDYKKMYLHMFNEITNTIEALKKVQLECEELFLSYDCEDDQKSPSEK